MKDRKQILFIDDEPIIRDWFQDLAPLISDVLVTIEGDSQKAVDIIRHEKIDLVITDLNMPFMSGLEILEEVKKKDPDLPVILFTGSLENDVEQRALDAGISEIITKPAELSRFIQTIKNYV